MRACAPGCLRARNPRVAMMAWNPVPLCGAPYGCRTPGSPRGLGHDVVWNLTPRARMEEQAQSAQAA
jgi:hypothetical protein